MRAFEYMVCEINVNTKDLTYLCDDQWVPLDQLGEKGWELVTVSWEDYKAILKREFERE